MSPGLTRHLSGIYPGCTRTFRGCIRVYPGDCRDILVDLQMAYRLDLE
jgi:hypothetical protein